MYGTAESALATWESSHCAFPIQYAPRVLDDIRLAVVDAFFSLPRGGAEIGGILLGTWADGRLTIADYAPLDCEHATGPSFTLSPNDEGRLRDLLDGARSSTPGLYPVGWYHSHTRSGIFLSEADLEIHARFFPEPWQVALVIRPHTFEPTRAGFFFREASGEIQAAVSCAEFTLEPLPVRTVPVDPPKMGGSPVGLRVERNVAMEIPAAAERVLEATATDGMRDGVGAGGAKELDDSAAGTLAAVAAEAPFPPPPRFLTEPPAAAASRRVGVLLAIAAVLALAAVGYQTRNLWLSKTLAAIKPQGTPAPGSQALLGLNTFDRDGQLQINWERNAPAIRNAVEAILEISDGGPFPQAISLDPAHLQNGFFTYARQSERVDVKLILHQPDGQQIRDVTTFLGKLPARKAPEDDEDARKERERVAAEAAKLKTDLDTQAARTRKLEKDLKGVQDELRNQQQRRMANQIPDGKQ